MSANVNPVTTALKTAIGQGTKFRLVQSTEDPHQVTLEVSGGVSKTSLTLPFTWINSSDKAGEGAISGFVWESNNFTASILASAVESLPAESAPQFAVNTSLWTTGGLLITGTWSVKKGRAKEGTPNNRTFLLDCGVLDG